MSKPELHNYIGLISGTSMDSIDAALVCFENDTLNLQASYSYDYPDEVKKRLTDLINHPHSIDLDELGQLDVMVAHCFSDAVNLLLEQENLDPQEITALGSHGQTVRHRSELKYPFSMQLGDPSHIAALTGIKTVADFRAKDIALAGQGAPLVPAFHKAVFASNDHDRIILNLGGISNLSLLKKTGEIRGHDCGPGNTLMDQWALTHIGMPFDHSGAWAKMGHIEPTLLLQLMTDEYFKLSPPKSTGREYFNLRWLQESLSNFEQLDPVDVQATLCELTAQSIACDINALTQSDNLELDKVYVCGGGAHNIYLTERIASLIPVDVTLSDELGISVDWVEAAAFAWLAKQTLSHLPGNHPDVTGAKQLTILGGVYFA